ncbi:hypothetical protein A2U01_0065273, partial [Trifolium medium]|nr:hypothetical protein [Trifolium medium]
KWENKESKLTFSISWSCHGREEHWHGRGETICFAWHGRDTAWYGRDQTSDP